jgi:PTH1 family peptidyl-tRNA hydrolase
MQYVLVGLGNPGIEYDETRHNVGFIILDALTKQFDFEEAVFDKKKNARIGGGTLGKHKIVTIYPETFMNNSGKAVAPFIKSKKDAERLVVIHDELDVPLGRVKMSFGKNSGGHNGIESVIKAAKTKDFVRIRVGISPVTASGKIRKPSGEKEVITFILGKFKPAELAELKKLSKKIGPAIETLVKEGRDKATGELNSL